MNKELTEIVMLLDRSGSMEEIKADMIGGMNQFVEDQKKQPGQANFTFAQFDTEYQVLIEGKKIAEVGPLDSVPRGCTALLDAVGRIINTTGDRFSKLSEDNKPGKVLIIVITDGHENSSHEFTKKKIVEMVEDRKKKDNWQFVFLGASPDQMDEGISLGVGVSQAMSYNTTPQGIRAAYSSLSSCTSNYRGACGQAVFSFTEDDRNKQK